jgi:hypothetical protein
VVTEGRCGVDVAAVGRPHPANRVGRAAPEVSWAGKKGDGADYGDARAEHQHFREIKARKYWYFRHGYFPQVPPDTDG